MLRSVQRELNGFFKVLKGSSFDIQEVTKGALTQARAKLKPEAFVELNQAVIPSFYEDAPYYIWKEHRLLAIDGSTLNLPDHPSVEEDFGVHYVGGNADVKRSMAHISMCYDVLNLLTLDARIDKFVTSEQVLMRQHLEAVTFMKGDVLLLDRGYPSFSLMYDLTHRGVGFCMRLKASWWKEIERMVANGETDKEIFFKLPPKDQVLKAKYKSRAEGVTVRVVVIELDTGEKEVLCTSLRDRAIYSLEDLKELYHCRWGVEEAYKLLKCRVGLEKFSGKTAKAVRQDFHAKIFMMTMCAILSFPLEQKVREESKKAQQKHQKKINRTNAIGYIRDNLTILWLKTKKVIKDLLEALDNVLEKSKDIVRPGRKFPRKHKIKHPPPMTYKQL
jgi:hypothetical protein